LGKHERRLSGIQGELEVLHWVKMSKMTNIEIERPMNLLP